MANFRSLFIGESSSPNRSTTQTGQTSYTTQSPSIGWAVSRVRQQNDESAANSANSLTDRNPTLPDNNNAESSGIAVNSRHIKTKHHYNSNENDVFQTKIQLAATFALLTKMMDELLLRLIQHEQYAKQSHTGISHLLELRSIAQIASNFKVIYLYYNFYCLFRLLSTKDLKLHGNGLPKLWTKSKLCCDSEMPC